MSAPLRFAHLSDWHATTLVGGGTERFRGKRLSGWASWWLNRRRHHDPRILEAAFRDVHTQDLDRILVTGDLTHVSLEQEFRVAAEQLRRLGPPSRVFLVPGNHDCYVATAPESSWDLWASYLAGDPLETLDAELADGLASPLLDDRAPRYGDYPTVRLSGELALIGLCSSIPTPIFRAGGELGSRQLGRLERLLSILGERGLCRVVLIHHPVARRGEPARRALWDGEALREVLGRAGAELVLHGHKHRRRIAYTPGPLGPVPIVGVPSTSEVGSKPDKQAQYHVYSAVRESDGASLRYRIEGSVRAYDPERGEYGPIDDVIL